MGPRQIVNGRNAHPSMDEDILDLQVQETMVKRTSSLKKNSSTNNLVVAKELTFGHVKVIEFRIILGDNPDVSDGCPVSIHGKGKTTECLDLSFYESHREGKRRSRNKLRLSVTDRAQILLGAGYSIYDIANATLEVERVKKMRAESNRNQKWDGVNAFVQYTGKSLRRMIAPKPAGAMSA